MEQTPFTCKHCGGYFVNPSQWFIHERTCPLLIYQQNQPSSHFLPITSDPIHNISPLSNPYQSNSLHFQASFGPHHPVISSVSVLSSLQIYNMQSTGYLLTPSTFNPSPNFGLNWPVIRRNDQDSGQMDAISRNISDPFTGAARALFPHNSVEGYQNMPAPLTQKPTNTSNQSDMICNTSEHKRKSHDDVEEVVTPSKFARSDVDYPYEDSNRTSTSCAKKTQEDMNDIPRKARHKYGTLTEPIRLYHELDENNLTQLQCFIRKRCIDVFTAAEDDEHEPSRGKSNTIVTGQVGIRCSFCRLASSGTARGGIYFPRSIELIYAACMNLIQRHFFECPFIPIPVKEKYCELKIMNARSGVSRVYWTLSATNLGLVDTPSGIRYCPEAATGFAHDDASPSEEIVPAANGDTNCHLKSDHNYYASSMHKKSWDERVADNDNNRMTFFESLSEYGKIMNNNVCEIKESKGESTSSSSSSQTRTEAVALDFLCLPEDQAYITRFTYVIMRQMTFCTFTEADRHGKRKDLSLGFGGIACHHCISDYGTGRFFPSSLKTLSDTTKTLNALYTHILQCRKCPSSVKEELNDLRKSHEQERADLLFGSQKAFFSRIWSRVHDRFSA